MTATAPLASDSSIAAAPFWSAQHWSNPFARDATLAAPEWLHALWLIPALLALVAWSAARRRAALQRLADPALLAEIAPAARPGFSLDAIVRSALASLAVAAVVVALARPQSDPEQQTASRRGRDVVFVVDVSRSMLARDLAPSRLERAKLWIRDLLPKLRGDRVGLVAFAGAARVICPLTHDRGFLRLTLEELTPDAVPIGGTMTGDAIRKAVDDAFGLALTDDDTGEPLANDPEPAATTPPLDDLAPFRDIILISDGDDQGSFPEQAAAAAGALGIRIITLGLGSTDQGAVVPAREGGAALDAEGNTVRSTLNPDTLATIAAATPGGAFLNVGTGTIDLEEIYEGLIRSAQQTELGQTTATRYRERFVPFLVLAAALLAIEPIVRPRRTRP